MLPPTASARIPSFLLTSLWLMGSASLPAALTQLNAGTAFLNDYPGDLALLPPGSGDFGPIAGGDVTGDLVPEIVTIRGTTLYWIAGSEYPTQHTACVELVGEVVLDVCYSTAKGFLITTPGGLKLVSLTNGLLGATLLNQQGDWAGAVELEVGSGVGDAPAVFGVSSDRKRIVRSLLSDVPNTPPTIVATLGPSISDLSPLNWDDNKNNGDEFGILTSNGVQIRQQDPQVALVARSAVKPGDAIATVRQTDQTDALVWITKTSANPVINTQSLIVLHGSLQNGYQAQIATLPTGLVTSIATADLDDDADTDLILSQAGNSYELRVVKNLVNGTWHSAFSQVSSTIIRMGGLGETGASTGEVLAIPLWNSAGLQGGLMPDFALALPSLNVIRRVPGDFYFPVEHTSNATYLQTKQPPYFTDADYCTQDAWTLTMGQWSPNLTTANGMQVKVYRRFAPLTDANQATGVFHLGYHFTPPSPAGYSLRVPLAEFIAFGESDIFFVQVRPIRTASTSTTTILQAWNWVVLGLSGDDAVRTALNAHGATTGNVSGHANVCWPPAPTPPPGASAGSGGGGTRLIPSPVIMSQIPLPGIVPGTLSTTPAELWRWAEYYQ
ncbi:MAG: hypothetical protein ABL998_02305 [Planctomycetota bacterium]